MTLRHSLAAPLTAAALAAVALAAVAHASSDPVQNSLGGSAAYQPTEAAYAPPAPAEPPLAAGPTNPGQPGEAPGVPVDGGLALLALAGGAYAARRLRARRPSAGRDAAAALALLVLPAAGAQAQGAVLSPGDLAVTQLYGFYGGSTGGDTFSLVALVDLPAGTPFRVTDRGWDGTALVADAAGNGEFAYVAPCEVPAGTVFRVQFLSPVAFESTGVCPAGGPNAGASFASGFSVLGGTQGPTEPAFSLSQSGDQVTVYQAGAVSGNTTTNGSAFPRFIFSLTTVSDFVTGAVTPNTTRVPPNLDRGATAVFLPTVNAVYNGIASGSPAAALRTGSRGQLLLNVATASNWTGSNTNNQPAQSQLLGFTVDGNAAAGAATALGGAGWRNLAVPGAGLSVAELVAANGGTGINFVQGLADEMPVGTNGARLVPNLYLGYNGDNADDQLRPGGFRENNLGFVPPNDEAAAITPGKGLLWYFYDVAAGPFAAQGGQTVSRALPVLLPAVGAELTADVTVSFTAAERTSARDGAVRPNGFYFLGNPFRAAFDLSGVSETTAAGVQSAFAFWNPNAGGPQVPAGNGTPGSYVVRNAVADAANSALDDAQVWQGFYAEVTGATEAPLPAFSLAAAARQTDSRPTFYGRSGQTAAAATLAFQLEGQTPAGPTFDAAAQLYFTPDGAEAWDAYDLSDLGSLGAPSATLRPVGVGPGGEAGYALMQRALPLALDAAVATPLRLALDGAPAGSFALAWTLDGLPAAWSVSLADVVTGAVVDLRAAPGYTFEAAAGESERFVLTVAPRTVAADAPTAVAALALSAPAPNPASGAARMTLVGVGGPAEVALFDALGRRVATLFAGDLAAGQSATVQADAAALAPGVYAVRATSGPASVTHRFVVAR